jgi:DNA-binding transcriptional LysR family regulator
MAARPDTDLRLLRAFVLLADELNFRRAAEQIRITQPALSAQLRQLEERLELTLFERSTRRVSLTSAGARLLAAARALLAESDRFAELAAEIRGAPKRPLIFGAALYTLAIPERQTLIDAFLAQRPNQPFEVAPFWQRDMVRALLREEADLALMVGVAVPLSQWRAERMAEVAFPDSLPRLVLREQRVSLLVPRESPLAGHEEIPASQLAGVEIAMLGPSHGSAIIDPLQATLGVAGARLCVPPEPHAIGVERYGRQFRMPAVCLGWFESEAGPYPDMVRRPVTGLTLTTELALISSASPSDPATDFFWNEAAARFPHSRRVPPRGDRTGLSAPERV